MDQSRHSPSRLTMLSNSAVETNQSMSFRNQPVKAVDFGRPGSDFRAFTYKDKDDEGKYAHTVDMMSPPAISKYSGSKMVFDEDV